MFLDPNDFHWTRTLENEWQTARDEFAALPKNALQAWVQREMHAGDWTTFGLFALGQPIPQGAALCPRTMQILANVPGLAMAGFSRLKAGAHIAAHCGWAASVFRLHLGLIVPDGCFLRVGDEKRAWQNGKCLIFDDTVNHEAWNSAPTERVVLLLDFLRPGATASAADHIPPEVARYARSLLGG